MPAGRGEWIIRNGVRVRDPQLERGRLLLSTDQEQRRRLGRFAMTMSLLTWSPLMLVVVILWVLTASAITDPFMRLVGLLALFLTILVLPVILMALRAHGFVPGVYLNGVQLVGRVFVPFEEVGRTTSRRRPWGRELRLHPRMSKLEDGLEEILYGTDGLDYVEARVKGMMEGTDIVPPRLVVYPKGEDMGETTRKS